MTHLIILLSCTPLLILIIIMFVKLFTVYTTKVTADKEDSNMYESSKLSTVLNENSSI